ncbi:flagellin [Sulfurimonas sp.]|uniref:flagellin n=1 Tax=Sulfurimonas sp. TaxID=2022749 RepID=UPI00356A9FCC
MNILNAVDETIQNKLDISKYKSKNMYFTKESSNFSKHNILSRTGSYIMCQANARQQKVMRLLQ